MFPINEDWISYLKIYWNGYNFMKNLYDQGIGWKHTTMNEQKMLLKKLNFKTICFFLDC